MKRLTHRNEEFGYVWSPYDTTDITNKLADYEDAEEQGLLLRLPCKVGDTVYTLIPFCEICEEYLDEPEYCGEKKHCGSQVVSEMKFGIDYIYEVGKSVFLTKEEAEQKSASMQKGE